MEKYTKDSLYRDSISLNGRKNWFVNWLISIYREFPLWELLQGFLKEKTRGRDLGSQNRDFCLSEGLQY